VQTTNTHTLNTPNFILFFVGYACDYNNEFSDNDGKRKQNTMARTHVKRLFLLRRTKTNTKNMDGEGGKPPKKSVNTIQSEKAKATIEKREAKGGRVFFFLFYF